VHVERSERLSMSAKDLMTIGQSLGEPVG
jgi:hypothetical protein